MSFWIRFILLFPIFLQAELIWNTIQNDISIGLEFSSEHITLEQPLTVKANIHSPSSDKMNKNMLIHQLTHSFNPLQSVFAIQEVVQTSQEENQKQRTNFSLILSPLQVGEIPLSFLNILFETTKEEKIKNIFTPIFSIEVANSEELDKQFLPIAPLFSIDRQFPLTLTERNRIDIYENKKQLDLEAERNQKIFSERTIPWLTILLLLCLLLAWYGRNIFFLRHITLLSEKSPELNAQQTLLLLKQEQLPQQGLYKSFYTQLQDLLLSHLEKHLKMRLKSFTAEELHFQLIQSNFSPTWIDPIVNFIKKANQIRFSNDPLINIEWEMDEKFVETIVFSHPSSNHF
ncbi:Uncharacterized protein PRO82_002066 [Candidatus Protochlamydia amoebophila]|uniref:hypothetical protein n=1 Tax=Candidatus Protochlamydia amoebophila TaxID=362787 RepID=UPI001BC93D1C|nr:hypothetical protein [Candidatus Protochlamydia amoebophila]MBS4164735.1 Uncharacterized protein [Candidatus Protochlamydia amoebophila]